MEKPVCPGAADNAVAQRVPARVARGDKADRSAVGRVFHDLQRCPRGLGATLLTFRSKLTTLVPSSLSVAVMRTVVVKSSLVA